MLRASEQQSPSGDKSLKLLLKFSPLRGAECDKPLECGIGHQVLVAIPRHARRLLLSHKGSEVTGRNQLTGPRPGQAELSDRLFVEGSKQLEVGHSLLVRQWTFQIRIR